MWLQKKKIPQNHHQQQKRDDGFRCELFPRHEMSFQAEMTLSEVKVEAVYKHLAALSKAGKRDDVILVLHVTGIPQWTWDTPTVICLLHKHALLINSNGNIKGSLFSVGVFIAPVTALSQPFTTFVVFLPQLFRQDVRVIPVLRLGILKCIEMYWRSQKK